MKKKGLSQIAIRAMSIRLFIAITLSSLGGYFYNYRVIKEKTISELDKYVSERVERESLPFIQAKEHLELLAKEFKVRFEDEKTHFLKEFDQKFQLMPDGSYRSRQFGGKRDVQFFLPKSEKLTPQMKKRAVILFELLRDFGLAWSPTFLNLWSSGLDDMGMAFWPSSPYALRDVPPDFSFKQYEYMQIGFPQQNPQGMPSWTGPYFDVMINDWLISINYPIYQNGQYLMSLGLDLNLIQMHKRTLSNNFKDTFNVIFSRDGRLVTHPEYMDTIIKESGRFYIQNSGDKKLIHIYQKALEKPGKVVYDAQNKLFLASGIIHGPDWIFVLVYPEKNLLSLATQTAKFTIIVGIVILLIEIFMMYQVLEQYVVRPIQKLINASNELGHTHIPNPVDIHSNDEIGMLAKAFNRMSKKIYQRDRELIEQATKLEEMVSQRTHELDIQRAKAFNSSKMATLGEMAGGMAHEINNPLAVISMSAETIKRVMKKRNLQDRELESFVEKIIHTVFRISKIVKGMRSFSRNADLDPLKSHTLKEVIEDALSLCMERLHIAGVKLICEPIPDIHLNCRDGQIIQTLLNLIQNSIDAIENLPERWISIHFVIESSKLKIKLTDSGKGLDSEVADKIMQPFFTTKEVGKGTGLGLFISSGLILSNNGKLYFDSSSEHTCFVIELPINVYQSE